MGSSDKIAAVDVWVVEVPLRKTWRISLYSADVRYHVVVRLATEEGLEGFGEVSPAAAFMGEDARIIRGVIETFLSPVLLGADLFDLELIHARMDRAIQGNGAAKAAVDIALHDLMGKRLGVPVYRLLGGRFRSTVPLTWVLGIQEVEGALEEARRFVEMGVRTIKFKIGQDLARDLRMLEALRDTFGEGINLRVDANQGYRADQAVKALRAMEAFHLESVEQPVPAWDLEGMRAVAEALDTPVMADESVFSLHDAHKVIVMRAADILNIKVGKVGGLHPARKIAAMAQAAGIPVTIGSNLELGIGSAASIHFGISTANVLYPCDLLLGPELHHFDLIDPPFSMEGGEVEPPEDPGLGVKLNSKALEGSW